MKAKRLLTDAELDVFIKLREESNIKAARYMKSLQNELWEVTDDEYGRTNTGTKRSRDIKTTKD